MASASINNLVDEGGGIIVFRTSFVQIQKISADAYGALFFHDRNKVGNPGCIGDGVDKPDFVKLVDFSLDFFCLRYV